MARRDFYHDAAAPQANSIVVAVTAAVRNERGEISLIQRSDNGLWVLPGGAQDTGETVVDAIRREVVSGLRPRRPNQANVDRR